jgi:hypothetical protein
MKRVHHISAAVQVQIVNEYKQKSPDGNYTYTLKEIADNHEVSLSTVNKLAGMAQCQGRPRGGRTQTVPNARTMKILRDASEPGVTLEEVGRRNPRVIIVNGRRKKVPLTRERVRQIVQTWKERLDANTLHGRGFKPGDKIDWASIPHVVVLYHNSRQGAVIDLVDKKLIDPFCWIYKGFRSKLVEAAAEELTPEQVLERYLGHVPAHYRVSDRAAAQRPDKAAPRRRAVSKGTGDNVR